MKFKRIVKQQVDVATLRAAMGVRFWEHASVNGVDEQEDAPTIPFAKGDVWQIDIDLANGRIFGWPGGTVANAHYEVCDAGVYSLLDAAGDVVASKEGYVPGMLSPGGEGYGDYVIMEIDSDGIIKGWRADLSYFDGGEP